MPQDCRTCISPQRAIADALIAEGDLSYRAIALRLGLSRDSVRRHADSGHVLDAAPVPTPDADLPDEGVTVGQLLTEAMRKLRELDTRTMSPGVVVAHVDAVRKLGEAIARNEPPKGEVTARVEDVVGMPEFVALLFELMEPYPDLRERLKVEMEVRGIFA